MDFPSIFKIYARGAKESLPYIRVDTKYIFTKHYYFWILHPNMMIYCVPYITPTPLANTCIIWVHGRNLHLPVFVHSLSVMGVVKQFKFHMAVPIRFQYHSDFIILDEPASFTRR